MSPIVKRMMFLLIFVLFIPLYSQDEIITFSITEIENFLKDESISVRVPRDIRYKGDIAKRAMLADSSGKLMMSKVKQAPEDGDGVNNQPRYELAAYEIQKLFLDQEEYVVPPGILRVFNPEICQQLGISDPTFRDTKSTLFFVQYWLNNVTYNDKLDKKRFNSDLLYAKHVGNLNILTYLIRHSDSNKGNILISELEHNPRIFAVDNGVAFNSPESKRGTFWRSIRVKTIPNKTYEKLKNITHRQLKEKLGVLVQFKLDDGILNPDTITENIDPYSGVRQKNGIIQFGLTSLEIEAIHRRLEKLIDQVESGKIPLCKYDQNM